MKAIFPLIFIQVMCHGILCGQVSNSSENRYRSYSVELRSGLNQIREQELLPLVHKGMVTEFSLEKEKVKSSFRQFQLLLSYSRLKTSLEEMAKSGNIRVGLNYSYNFRILNQNNFRYYAGPQTSLLYSFMLYPNWDESHSYWADYFCLGASNIVSASFSRNREWFSSLNFSILGLFSRPDPVRPYKMDNYTTVGVWEALNSNVAAGLMHDLLLINYRTEYRFPVFTRMREAITFNMNIVRLSRNDGNPVFQIINTFGIKIML